MKKENGRKSACFTDKSNPSGPDPSANPKQVTGKNSKIILNFVESALIKASSSMKIKVTELKFKCIL